MPITPITILIADAHTLTRNGLAKIVETREDIVITAITDNSEELLHLCNENQPDVIIMGTILNDVNSLQVSSHLAEEFPLMHIIMMADEQDGATIMAMQVAGVHGWFYKSATEEEILQTIQDVHEGRRSNQHNGYRLTEKKRPAIKALTAREKALLPAICSGLTAREIAAQENVSRRTIENHKASIMEKLHIKSTAGIILYAIRNNIHIANIIYWLMVLFGTDMPGIFDCSDGM